MRRTAIAALFALSTMLGGCGAAGATVITHPTGQGPGTIRIENMSNESVYYIYMSPAAQSTWGPDLLGSNVLQGGQAFTISNVEPGTWDLRVVDESRNWKEWRNFSVGAGGAYSLQVNNSGWHQAQ